MSQNDWQESRPLVIDTNTALSGLIGGATRKLIVDLERDLRYPEPSFEEIRRNRGVIQERAGLSATAIDELIDRLFKNITLVPEADVLLQYRTAAEATSSHPDADQERQFEGRDEDDVVFLAAAIATGGDIWSDDKVFGHQDYASWFRTEDVIQHGGVEL
ncbi:Predicted nucleic acid-binding protein, contains PIN domain [Halomicrobium zhouii]|uniref:Predicted nucleic acid-binding protein, contains PIN domain n=1 Tax=Halomicrobium zhouii TaxID=767519 RepID=A0A1I6L9H2_9EURY|nr:PIN domain-containing protein [Halomicrobium zhouii]SFS00111.1 Predicted nucleic acid-binding protein, contains PIN domain [Halomicrobium zhouii]